MSDELGHLREKKTVAHHGRPLDLVVMALDKPHMSEKRFEIHLTRKGFGEDHQPRQFSMFRDVGIDLLGQAFNIGRFERNCGLENECSLGETEDQRRFPRPVDIPVEPNADDGCDVGAYEKEP